MQNLRLFHDGKARKGEKMVKDIVCGMDIEKENAVGAVKHDRDTHYFCSQFCLAAFLENPLKYLPDDESRFRDRKVEGLKS